MDFGRPTGTARSARFRAFFSDDGGSGCAGGLGWQDANAAAHCCWWCAGWRCRRHGRPRRRILTADAEAARVTPTRAAPIWTRQPEPSPAQAASERRDRCQLGATSSRSAAGKRSSAAPLRCPSSPAPRTGIRPGIPPGRPAPAGRAVAAACGARVNLQRPVSNLTCRPPGWCGGSSPSAPPGQQPALRRARSRLSSRDRERCEELGPSGG